MTPYDGAPLSDAEHRALREITQHLTRTDPDLLGAPGTPPAGRRRWGWVVTGACLAVSLVALVAGALVALGIGSLFILAIAAVTTIGLRRASSRRSRDTS